MSSPLISVLTPVHDPDPRHLTACLVSVITQTIDDWEHVLVDDGSASPEVRRILARAAEKDPRVRLITRPAQGGIVAATRDALDAATGELVAFIDHDDIVEPDALAAMVAVLDDDTDVAYSDHDFIRPDGRYVDPCYKPDFSPERLRSQNYVTHLVMARRSSVIDAGGVREGLDGAQDHDLMLRLGERARRIAHVPRILYHWRQSPTSVSGGTDAKAWAFDAGVRAVADHCDRVGIDATVETTDHEGIYRVRRRSGDTASHGLTSDRPLVSVVIPTRGTAGRVWGATRCFVHDAIRSIVERSTYGALEFVVVADDETPQPVIRALRDLAGDALTLLPFTGAFNFSAKMNLGAAAASGDLLLLLNDDTELIEPTSIEELAAIVTGPAEGLDGRSGDVAMAGAKLLFSDGTLQHGGHVYHHDLLHACFGWDGDAAGPWPLRPLATARECSGVTAAAAVVRRDAFEAVGGFTTELPLNYNDVDLSLKLRADGHRIVWTPWASWYHFESRTRTSVILGDEYASIDRRWRNEINHDPYYNPNLAIDRSDWLELPLRSGAAPIVARRNAAARAFAGRQVE